MPDVLKADSEARVVEAIKAALENEAPLEIIAAGTKRGIGRPVEAATILDVSGLSGVTLYEPEELILSMRAGTLRAEAEALIAQRGQAFAFEPPDLSRLLDAEHAGTVGGMAAANLAGPRRIKSGAARDHLLGFTAVSGRGETFRSGGRVMKNVTGYDLSKLMAGSWGTLAVMTDITFKVLPRPATETTVAVLGLDDAAAARTMSAALGSPFEVSGAAHLPADLARLSSVGDIAAAAASVTLLRIEGVGPSVAARTQAVAALLRSHGAQTRLEEPASRALWAELRDVHLLAEPRDRLIWRVSVPPMEGARVMAAIRQTVQVQGYYDWGGGLLWLALPPAPHAFAETLRGAIGRSTGHATLIRAPAETRATVPVFEPQGKALRDLTQRVKESFDPKTVLNPGRVFRQA